MSALVQPQSAACVHTSEPSNGSRRCLAAAIFFALARSDDGGVASGSSSATRASSVGAARADAEGEAEVRGAAGEAKSQMWWRRPTKSAARR